MSDIDVKPEEVKQFVNKQGKNLFSNLSDENRRKIKDLDIKVNSLNQELITEIENRQDADVEFANNLSELDSKVDGINANLTQQIEETQQDVNDKYNELIRDIDDLTDVVEEDYNTLNQRITDVASDLQESIEENVVALQQEDTALQNQINTQNQTLTNHNTRITNNANAIAQEIIDRQNADDALNDRIDAVESRGRFLALWDAITGLPESTPQITPYTYKTGDYYIVDTVGDVNYRPTGTEFVEGQPSTEIETEELTTDDVYYYDGAVWRLQVNHGKTVSFGNLTGQPSDNTALKQALDSKQNVITNLSTIESNAQAGKNASDTIATYGNIVTHNASEFQPAGDYATNTALTQGLATKQNITDNNLVTTAKTVVGAVNELDAKIKDIQLYKFPNAIIIGQPTINNGQISGFTQQNYLTLPFLFDVGDRAFEFNYAFRTGDNVTIPQNLFGSNYCIASYIQNGKLNVRVSSNGISWDIVSLETSLNVLANTVYYIKIVFNKLNYTISASTDGTTYNQIGYVVNTKKPIAGNVFIGIGNNQNNPFLGVINLNRWDIRLNNSIIWEGMDDVGLATRADISLSNLDEQGEARFEAKQDVIDDLKQIRTNANLVTTKQDIISDLSTIRSNASIGAGLAPQVAVNTQRIEDLTTARIPDVIYHGTPKITGGQVSNFSTINYLQFPFEDISRSLPLIFILALQQVMM